jgi:hypothetical protein
VKDIGKLCNLLGSGQSPDQLYFLIKKLSKGDSDVNIQDKTEFTKSLERSQTSSEGLKISFFKLMEAVEEFTEETGLNPTAVSSKAFSRLPINNDPVSIKDLE